MAFDLDAWLQEAAQRAGMRNVPVNVIKVVAVLAVAAVVFAAWRFWPSSSLTASGGEVESASAAGAPAQSMGSAPSTTSASVSASAPASAYVHVVGAVRSPGVYELAEGSRVADAVEKAGGMLPDAVPEAVNMARPVADGEQILVPDEDSVKKSALAGAAGASAGVTGGTAAAGASTGAASSASGAGPAAKVNINMADAAALDSLPGVGPSTAAKIIAEREANGPFASADDLGRVPGIGPKRLEQLRDLVSVAP